MLNHYMEKFDCPDSLLFANTPATLHFEFNAKIANENSTDISANISATRANVSTTSYVSFGDGTCSEPIINNYSQNINSENNLNINIDDCDSNRIIAEEYIRFENEIKLFSEWIKNSTNKISKLRKNAIKILKTLSNEDEKFVNVIKIVDKCIKVVINNFELYSTKNPSFFAIKNGETYITVIPGFSFHNIERDVSKKINKDDFIETLWITVDRIFVVSYRLLKLTKGNDITINDDIDDYANKNHDKYFAQTPIDITTLSLKGASDIGTNNLFQTVVNNAKDMKLGGSLNSLTNMIGGDGLKKFIETLKKIDVNDIKMVADDFKKTQKNMSKNVSDVIEAVTSSLTENLNDFKNKENIGATDLFSLLQKSSSSLRSMKNKISKDDCLTTIHSLTKYISKKQDEDENKDSDVSNLTDAIDHLSNKLSGNSEIGKDEGEKIIDDCKKMLGNNKILDKFGFDIGDMFSAFSKVAK